MNLPHLLWQNAYGRLGWAVVLAAVVLAVTALRQPPSRRTVLATLGAFAVLMSLPGPWSPAHWIGLAFQRPSALGIALCVLSIEARWSGRTDRPTMPAALAAALAFAGALLYLDASGWIARGVYPSGFGPVGAPVAGLLIGVGAAAALVMGRGTAHALALLAAVLAFALCRLPTGNLWDALIDPFLWVWAVVVLARRVPRPRRRRRHPPVASAEPATVL